MGEKRGHSRRSLQGLSWLLGLTLSSPLLAADLTLDQTSDFMVAIEVNGQTLRLRVDPGANGIIVLNPAAAKRARLEASAIDREIAKSLGISDPSAGNSRSAPAGFSDAAIGGAATSRIDNSAPNVTPYARLGPVLATGKLSLGQTVIAGKPVSKLYTWFDNDVVAGADGIISPGELPYSTVTFRFRAPAEGETRYVFGGEYRPLTGFFFRHSVKDRDVIVKISVLEPTSMATAAAGAVIADFHGGKWTGESRVHPIALDVSRPVRPMALRKPLSLQGMKLRDLLVRTADHRGGYHLSVEELGDPDEIIVTARSRQPARFQLTLGTDKLSSCSSLIYQQAVKRLTLKCAPPPV